MENNMQYIDLKMSRKTINIDVLDTLKFSDNPALVNYINKIYPKHNFYIVAHPVFTKADMSGMLACRTIISDIKLVAPLILSSVDDTVSFGEFQNKELNDLIIPIIDELVHKTDKVDIYLLSIQSNRMTTNMGKVEMTFKVQGYF